MRIARPSVIVGVVVTAVLLAGCGRGQQEQSVAEQLVNAQGQAAGSGQTGPGSPTGSPDDTTASPAASGSDDASSDAPTSDDSSALPTTGHSQSESPESHAASPSSSRTKSESASPSATSRPRPSTSPTPSGGGGGTQANRIRVSKCYTNATSSTGGELLIKASSSDPNATLVAYRSDGSHIGEVQNGGGSRYGGTVMPYQSKDPGACVIKSSSGGSISVPTTPFKL